METIAVWQCDSVVQFCVCTRNQKTCNVLFTLTSKIMTSNLWQNKWFHMCVWAKLCASIYIFVLITGIVWTLYKIEFWVFLFIWLVILDGISSNRLHNVSAWSCLKGVATNQFTPPPHSNSNTPGTASFCSHVIYYDNSARDNMLYGTSRTFNIIQNFGDPLKTTTRRSTTISTGESVKQEQMCKSLTSNAEQSEDVCHDFA